MKKVTIVLLLLVGAINIKAQDYYPLVEDGKQWNVLFSYPWSPPEPQHRYTNIYKIEGDTLLDDVVYKLLHTTRSEQLSDWSICGAIRETEDKQVFYRRNGSSDEQILYDFSMQIGDTICIYDHGYYKDFLVVVEIGETFVGNNPRRELVLEYPFGVTETWIEGVGSLYGIINSGAQFLMGGITDLLCYYENGDLIWQNTMPGFGRCYIINPDGIDETEEKTSLLLFPNPSKEKVTIEGIEAAKVEVYSAFGQLVKIVRETNELNVADLPEGLYLLCITDAVGISQTRRITIVK